MNKSYFIFIILLQSTLVFSQNNQPEIEINSVQINGVDQEVTFTYTLLDLENDSCEIWFKYSDDGGSYFEIPALDDLSGDIGSGILPGPERVMVWNFESLPGNIYDTRIKLFASDHTEVSIAGMVNQVDSASIFNFLSAIEGERHYISAPEQLTNVKTQISSAFEDAGLQTESQEFVFNSAEMENIIGRKPGSKNEAVTYIIDGHFDGVPGSPGADDNGSAVAGMLEALRILSQYEFEHSLRFIGFDAEELGLIGSQRYVQDGIKPFEEIDGVLNFEMIGYYSDEPNSQDIPEGFDLLFPDQYQQVSEDNFRGNFLFLCGNTASQSLINVYNQAASTYGPQLKVISVAVPGNGALTPDFRRSDHARFWDGGYQALMLTDAADFRNPNYHTPGDTIGTLNFEFMRYVVQATLATAAQLAVPIQVGFDEFDLSILAGVEDHHHDFPASVSIFPNPADQYLNLKFETKNAFKSRIEIFDLTGKKLHHEILMVESGTSTTQINPGILTDGAYILVLDSGDHRISRSFQIEK